MQQHQSGTADIRLAELIAALSLATDLGMGQPMEYVLCSCILAVRLGESLGLGERDLRELYYLALLRYIGCNAETHAMAAIVGDELALRSAFMTVDYGHPSELFTVIFTHFRRMNTGGSPVRLAGQLAHAFVAAPKVMREGAAAHCEVGQHLAARLGFGANIQQALGHAYEHWDGRGVPGGIKGENIAYLARITALSQDIIIFYRLSGVDAAVTMVKGRSGGAYDPKLVECFCQQAPHFLAGLETEPLWEEVLAVEPGAHPCLSDAQFDTACRAIADFVDIKSPYTLGHSSGVAELAAEAAGRCGLPEAEVISIRRAGMLHDVGRTGVSASIWGKPGPLSQTEWERVRLHPYYTERVLARPHALARVSALAALHHERLDGSGYHRGSKASALSLAARILAAADVYHAMTEPRPHRSERTPEAAATELQREARAGRLDGEAVQAVLAAAGHRVQAPQRERAAGLSEREVEVLRLLARGCSMKQIATLLTISPKTVDHHVQHIYTKIEVSTRAGAALFAMQHDLLSDMG